MNSELSHLISLQEIDVEIKRLTEEVESIPVRREELERQFSESFKEYLSVKHELEDAQAARRRLEVELEQEQQKGQKFKNDLMKATNEREYATAVREIDVARKAISAFETDVIKLMERVDKLEAQVSERSPEMESRRVEIDTQLKKWTESSAGNIAKLEALKEERATRMKALGTEARSEYQRLSRMRGGLALAEARDYKCLGCRMTIRPQVFSDIRRGSSLITCENCGRILYFKTEQVAT